jgi:hypothetical protein
VLFGMFKQMTTSQIQFTLISRKDCRRPGRRWVVRGLDREGNAANFVESEHIFIQKTDRVSHVASHVQIRGSIVLHWSMNPTLRWSPPVVISSNLDESI